jgi:hypothetical protein
MPQYRCNHRTGEWRHFHRQGKPLGKTERKWLSHYDMLSPPIGLFPQSMKPVPSILFYYRLEQNADVLVEEARKDQSKHCPSAQNE